MVAVAVEASEVVAAAAVAVVRSPDPLEPGVVVVPSQAVQTGQTGQYVFVVDKERKVEMRPIDVGRTWGEQSVVRRGLEAGEAVVTDGQMRLVAGADVTIREEATSQQGPSP